MKPSFAVATLVAALPLAQALVIPHNVDAITAFRAAEDNGELAGGDFAKLAKGRAGRKGGKHHGGGVAKSGRVGSAKAAAAANGPAPFVTTESARAKIIDDSYIIMFKEDVDDATIASHHLWVEQVHSDTLGQYAAEGTQHPLVTSADAGLKHVYDIDGVRGYAGKFLPDTIEAIRHHPAVAWVEHDSEVHATGFATENGAPWGLARVSHREGLSLGSFNKYLFDDEAGEGVTAYVVDTGINIEHDDFEGRASWGAAFGGNPEMDDNGHGTHCAGTITGKHYGVAKKANIVAVKVLSGAGSGSMSDVVKGVEFVAAAHKRDSANKKGYKGTTANMSLGGGKSPSLDLAVNGAVRAGVHFAVAAGNENQDACNTSPAGAEGPVTVGATALNDDRAYFSNWGKCVDIFAPGVNILSTYIGSNRAVATLSGTSMASPHICGLLSYYLSLQPSTDSEFATTGAVTPAQLKKQLVAFGTKGILTDLDDESPNVLAYNGGGKNISEFWHPEDSSAAANDDADENLFSILPISEAEIAEELDHIAEEAMDMFGAIRAGLGLGSHA